MTYIIKVEFFTVFKNAFFASLGEENVRGGFREVGLIPFNPDVVLLKLDVKLRTPTPPRPSSPTPTPWAGCLGAGKFGREFAGQGISASAIEQPLT